MSNEEYWENRAAWNMHGQMEEAEKAADAIAEIYRKASMWLSSEAQAIFERYMHKHKLSEKEARRLLETLKDKKSIQELLMKLKNSGSGESRKSLLAKLEAPAYRYRMERLENLQDQLDQVMRDVYQVEKDFSTDFYTRFAEEAYYRSIFEIQKKTGLAFSFSQVTSEQIDEVLSMNWSGRHYSERIWRNTGQLAQTLKEELLVNLLTGRTERETSELIMRQFGSGAMQARRLVRTESCFISGELTAMAYKECGLEKYQYLATLDLRTSRICRELDMQIFLLKDRKAGKNYPPMHPWCRSTTVSVISEEDLKRLTRSAYDPKTKRIIRVPASMNYAQWYKEYVEGDDAAQLQEKMIRNRSADRRQYSQYKKVLGKDMPDSLARFQEMKYNEPEKWGQLKEDYIHETKVHDFKEKLKSGEIPTNIKFQKQQEHILGSKKWIRRTREALTDEKTPPNMFSKDVDIEALVEQYKGQGTIKFRPGQQYPIEYISADRVIGKAFNLGTKKYVDTVRFAIRYSSKGVHLHPTKEI